MFQELAIGDGMQVSGSKTAADTNNPPHPTLLTTTNLEN
jgi:hypothetical protein